MSIDERRTLLEQKLKDLGSSLTAAKTRRLDKEALYQPDAAGVEPRGAARRDARTRLVQALRAELAIARAAERAARRSQGYLDDHPEVVRLRQQIDGTRQKIATRGTPDRPGGRERLPGRRRPGDGSAAAPRVGQGEALNLSQRGHQYDALKRDLEASQHPRRQHHHAPEADRRCPRRAGVEHPRHRPRDRPRKARFGPRRVRDIALSILLGLALRGRRRLPASTTSTARCGRPAIVRRLGLPLLGVIPETRRGAPDRRSWSRTGRKGAVREGVPGAPDRPRSAHRPPTNQGQVLLVTSTLPGEGKSLTSVNLALTLSSPDERVLLIDADLRRPALNTLLQGRRRARPVATCSRGTTAGAPMPPFATSPAQT